MNHASSIVRRYFDHHPHYYCTPLPLCSTAKLCTTAIAQHLRYYDIFAISRNMPHLLQMMQMTLSQQSSAIKSVMICQIFPNLVHRLLKHTVAVSTRRRSTQTWTNCLTLNKLSHLSSQALLKNSHLHGSDVFLSSDFINSECEEAKEDLGIKISMCCFRAPFLGDSAGLHTKARDMHERSKAIHAVGASRGE